MPPIAADLKARLQNMENAFNQAKVSDVANTDKAYTNYSDGKYRSLVSNAEIAESKTSGRLQINWEHTFLEGQYQGKTKIASEGIDDAEQLAYALRTVRKFGIDINSLTVGELPAALDLIVRSKPQCDIVLKTGKNSDFQNVYINKVDSDLVNNGVFPDAPADNASSGEKASPASEVPPTTAQPDTSGGTSSTAGSAADDGRIKIGTRVNFDLGGEQRKGMVKRIDGTDFYVISQGTEYKMGEEDFTVIS